MKIYIKRSGGIANLILEGEVDTGDLPSELSRKAEAMMDPERLQAISSTPRPRTPDGFRYEIRVEEGDALRNFTLDDDAVDGDERDVLDGLMREVRRKRRRGKPGR